MKLRLTLFSSIFLFLSICLSAQNNQVAGIIYDENMEPLTGVSVYAIGSNTGTTTDGAGRFTLKIPEEKTLLFSYIGYKNIELSTEDQHDDMVLIMESSAYELEEVVIIANGSSYGKHISCHCVTLKPTERAKINVELLSDKMVKIYPNPSYGSITIENKVPMQLISVYDAAGRLLQNINPHASQSTQDFSHWPAGMYYLQVDDGSGMVKTGAFSLIKH